MKREKCKDNRDSTSHIGQNSSRSPRQYCSSEYSPIPENQRKRKRRLDEDTLLLQDSVEKKVNRGRLSSKKQKVCAISDELPMTTAWTVSEEKEVTESSRSRNNQILSQESDSESVCDDDSVDNPLEDGNEGNKEDRDDSYKMKYPKILTNESFEEEVEAADLEMLSNSENSDIVSDMVKKEVAKDKKNLILMEDSVRITPVPSKNAMVVLLNHPASLTLYGYVSVTSLSGTVSVYGKEIKPRESKEPENPGKVFSTEKTGLIEVKTEKYENIWTSSNSFRTVKNKLAAIFSDERQALKVLKRYTDTSVLIFVESCILPAHLQFVQLYHPDIFQFRLEHRRGHYYIRDTENSIRFRDSVAALANHIATLTREKKLKEEPAPRILVYGLKNSGKSSLLRFLMNKVLNQFTQVYYLDGDPGQTEFAPPGVVSLTKVDEHVLGPPFSHPRKSDSMVFIGSVTASQSLDMYNKGIAKLMKVYREYLSEEILFVNTMGWMEGLGLDTLKNMLKIVDPTILIEITKTGDEFMFDYRDYVCSNTDFFQIPPQFPQNQSTRSITSPKYLRNLMLMSYFGQCQLPFEYPKYIHEFKTYCSGKWDEIPIYVFGKKVAPYKLVESIMCSIVALCEVDGSLILESDIQKFQKTLEYEPINECLGYGFVRAFDVKRHRLYIVTPLKPDQMAKVNSIMKGTILPPSGFFLNQCPGVPLLFTRLRPKSSNEDISETAEDFERPVYKRCKRIKQD